jgi:hypothetical protein
MMKQIVILLLGLGFFTMQMVKAQSSVYVAGFENNKVNDINVSVARYWKNGNAVSLTDGKTDSYCKMLTVNNVDVFVAGATSDTEGLFKPACWKNNSPTIFNAGSTSAFANSVSVKNNDIYISNESIGWKPVPNEYWKNNSPVSLKKTNAIITIKAVFVDAKNVVHAAGTHIEGEGDGFIYPVAAYWKNDEEILLADKKHESSGQAMFIEGSDVYIAGYETYVKENSKYVSGYIATYWKNGEAVHLSDKLKTNYATSIFVVNGDVYVAGYERQVETGKDVAKYWKNGKEIRLTDGTFYGRANAVYVHNNDVFVAGEINPETDVLKLATSETGMNRIAVYWKNGTLVRLTDKNNDASAASIFVK